MAGWPDRQRLGARPLVYRWHRARRPPSPGSTPPPRGLDSRQAAMIRAFWDSVTPELMACSRGGFGGLPMADRPASNTSRCLAPSWPTGNWRPPQRVGRIVWRSEAAPLERDNARPPPGRPPGRAPAIPPTAAAPRRVEAPPAAGRAGLLAASAGASRSLMTRPGIASPPARCPAKFFGKIRSWHSAILPG